MAPKRLFAVVTLLALTSILSSAWAESAELPTKSIAVFKNGLGFFTREGDVKLTDGWATSDIVPSAALGTFWVGSPKSGVRIERLVATQEDVSRKVPATTVQQILSANVGRKMRFNIDGKVISGTLISLPEGKTPAPNQPGYDSYRTLSYSPYDSRYSYSPYYSPVPPNYSSNLSRQQPVESSLALIKTGETTLAVSRESISSVEIDGEVATSRNITERVKRLRFKVSGTKDKAPVTMAYLQKGVSWSPAYLLELLDDKKARITMQGLLVNDVEDIDGADVYFAVGYPNFLWSDAISPLALTQSVTDFMNTLSASTFRGRYSPLMAQSMANSAVNYDALPVTPTGSQFSYSENNNLRGSVEEDLFLYTVKDVNLKKGERACYTVFTADVPYEHIYTWDVPDTSWVNPAGYANNDRKTESPEMQVWHKLLLTNNTDYPWTTAPGMVMSNGQPISQDTLNYMAKRANGKLKITVATDIKAKQDETEVSRGDGPVQILSARYIKSTVKGTLTITNLKAKPVTVSISKTLTGEVTEAASAVSSKRTAQSIRAVNPISVINWKVPLKPGEEKTLDYTYYNYISY